MNLALLLPVLLLPVLLLPVLLLPRLILPLTQRRAPGGPSHSAAGSAGELMVVDIQGCDDVYTDPQIHTQVGTDYGDGNLGVGGMALFFSTSVYDSLCERLGLLRFSLSPTEEARLEKHATEHLPSASATEASTVMSSALGASLPDAMAKATMEAEARANATQAKNSDLLRLAEHKILSRRRSIVGVAARICVAQALAKAARERISERNSERNSERASETGGEESPKPPPAAVPEPGGDDDVYEEFEVPLRAMPLTLLGDDAAAGEARRKEGLPEAPPPATPSGIPTPECWTSVETFNSQNNNNNATCQPLGVAIGTASPAAIGAVHAKMCEYALVGRLPLQEGEADVASAGHHLVCAAAAGHVQSLLDLRSLCRGLPASEVLVGVKMRSTEVEALAQWLPHITARLAAAGDVGAMIERAGMLNTSGRSADGLLWLRAAVQRFDEAGEEEQTTLTQFGCARYQLLQKLGDACAEAGERVAAGEAYQEASEAAMEAGRAKVSMKLAALAEEMGEEEEEEEV